MASRLIPSVHVLAAVLILAACATPSPVAGPAARPVAEPRWTTMTAVHRVHIDARAGTGREQRSITGVIAVARPDRFRLRALGPGSIALFDIVKSGADIRVVHGVPGASAGLQEQLLPAIGADLSAAYDLLPRPPDRRREVLRQEVRVTETGRQVLLQRFRQVQGRSVPTLISIRNSDLDYAVSIDVQSISLDETLDPALFLPLQGR